MLWAAALSPWAALGATYLWTPLAGGRAAWLRDLSAGGDAFRSGVVASHVALGVSLLGCLAIGVAQIVSPRWQPGNATNERRSAVASSAALAGPPLAALVVALVVARTP